MPTCELLTIIENIKENGSLMSWYSKNSGKQKIGEFDETEITRNNPWRIPQKTAFSMVEALGKAQ